MKKILRTWAMGMLVSGLPLVGGCYDQSNALPTNTAIASAEPAASTLPPVGAADGDAGVVSTVNSGPAEPAQPNTDKLVPTDLKLSANVAEVIKLAQSGVDETVMLSFVTNTTGVFNLGSEEIIYLNDLGISGAVITAMIQHDRTANETAAAPPVPSANEPITTALPPEPPPTYVPEYVDPQPVTTSDFYGTLSPYGSWVNVDGYGMCWQPTVVVVQPTWRPYCDRGRWINTDCGWYWLSDYSWGATTFHYGRWFSHARYGWCWTPDTVWSPAWVTWRYSNDYCGWAPLPPRATFTPSFGFTYFGRSVSASFDFGLAPDCFTFVAFNHFCDSRPYRHAVSRHHVTQIFKQTTIVNNIVRGNNNTVINKGIAPERVAAATRTEIRKVAVRDVQSVPGKGTRPERLDRDGKTLVVHRPKLSPTVTAPPADSSLVLKDELKKDSAFSPRTRVASSAPSRATTVRPDNRVTTRPSRTELDQSSPNAQPPTTVAPTTTQTTAADNEKSRGSRPRAATPFPGRMERQQEAAPTAVDPRILTRANERTLTKTDSAPQSPAVVVRPQERPVHVAPAPTTSVNIQTEPSRARATRETAPPGSIIVIGKQNEERARVNHFSVPERKALRTENDNSAVKRDAPRSQPAIPSFNDSPRSVPNYRPVTQTAPAPQSPVIIPQPARQTREETRVFRPEPSVPRREVEAPRAQPQFVAPQPRSQTFNPAPERPQVRSVPVESPRSHAVESRPAPAQAAPRQSTPAPERSQRDSSPPGKGRYER